MYLLTKHWTSWGIPIAEQKKTYDKTFFPRNSNGTTSRTAWRTILPVRNTSSIRVSYSMGHLLTSHSSPTFLSPLSLHPLFLLTNKKSVSQNIMTRSGRGREAALSLYRALLRAHAKHLPLDMRQLGDAYVKAEFRRLKAVTKGRGHQSGKRQKQVILSKSNSLKSCLLRTSNFLAFVCVPIFNRARIFDQDCSFGQCKSIFTTIKAFFVSSIVTILGDMIEPIHRKNMQPPLHGLLELGTNRFLANQM